MRWRTARMESLAVSTLVPSIRGGAHEAKRSATETIAAATLPFSILWRVRTRMIAAALVLLLVSACREARIDGSDPERARVTIVEARKSLPAERQNEFDHNLQL